jgi:hypothetical protein
MAMYDSKYYQQVLFGGKNKGEVATMSDKNADIVFGNPINPTVESPLFYTKLLDGFFEGLDNADNSPSMERQRKIEHTMKDLIESFHEALIRLDQDIEASVSFVKSEIENIGNNN